MAHILPALIAYVICLFNFNIFVTFKSEQIDPLSPLISSQIVKTALYFLLLDLNLYHSSFRKISTWALWFYEIIIGTFFIELVLGYGWFPLEKRLLGCIPFILRYLYYKAPANSFLRAVIILMSNSYFLMFVSYFLSILFLCCVLHATRIVDFRFMSLFGLKYFIQDVMVKLKKGVFHLGHQLNLVSLRPKRSRDNASYGSRKSYSKFKKCDRCCRGSIG